MTTTTFSVISLTLHFLAITSGVYHAEPVLKKREASNRFYQTKWSIKEIPHNLPEGWSLSPWISDDIKLGEVGGVAIDSHDNVYIFHRADREWDLDSFGVTDNIYQKRHLGPISLPTVLIFSGNGTLLRQWGSGIFYLPHGITVDKYDNVWVTDVALHQVIRFSPSLTTPTLVLGEKFVPGRDSQHFCKPTSVAVANNHDFFVADGYCNSRILKFNSNGVKILEWGRLAVNTVVRNPGIGEFDIPHALALAEDKGLICVADRENGRVQAFHMNNGSYVFQISSPLIGSRLFSISYSPAKGGLYFVVNGPEETPFILNHQTPVQGYVISSDLKFISQFGTNLIYPHGLAVSLDGNNIYVGELEPKKAWKFVHYENISHIGISSVHSEYVSLNNTPNVGGLAGAIVVTAACLIFGAIIIILAFIYSKSKKPGTSDSIKLLSDGDA